jgi:murein DD-endopeptidase MepM/ murein hydrolase activator NlpD
MPVPARSYDARHRAYDPRHRASKKAPAKPRRLFAGLALPTAAAAALTFTATGAAMSTSTTPPPVTVSQKARATPNARAVSSAKAGSAASDDPRSQAIADNAPAVVREDAADSSARSAQRESIAERALAANREEQAHSWQLPIQRFVLTSGFGFRWGRLHAGEDFAAPVGTKLVSMSSGTVTFAGEESGFGNLVKIRYWDGTVTFYGHMSRIAVSEGDSVVPGQVVGRSGNTGHSTGPHLHLEIHPDGGAAVNPLPWLADHQIAA